MTIYLTIITTVLVLTQIIRLIQNYISICHDKKRIDWIEDNYPSEYDFQAQRDYYYLAREYLREKMKDSLYTVKRDNEAHFQIDRDE